MRLSWPWNRTIPPLSADQIARLRGERGDAPPAPDNWRTEWLKAVTSPAEQAAPFTPTQEARLRELMREAMIVHSLGDPRGHNGLRRHYQLFYAEMDALALAGCEMSDETIEALAFAAEDRERAEAERGEMPTEIVRLMVSPREPRFTGVSRDPRRASRDA
jgi:hypothetical protein